MKKLLLGLGLLLAVQAVRGQAADERAVNVFGPRLLLDSEQPARKGPGPESAYADRIELREWAQALLPDSAATLSEAFDLPDERWRKTESPVCPDFAEGKGTLVMQAVFFRQPAWDFRELFLTVGQATGKNRIYVNGSLAGGAADSSAEAEYDITPYAREGNNTVTVVCYGRDSLSPLENVPGSPYGINGEVAVIAKNKLHLYDLDIFEEWLPDGGVYVETKVFLKSHLLNERPFRLHFRLLSPEGEVLAEGDRGGTAEGREIVEVVFPATVGTPCRWSAADPALYTVELTLRQDGRATETARQEIGLREVGFKGGLLRLNGEMVRCRAEAFVPDRLADSLKAAMTVDSLKRAGVGLLLCREPMPENYLAACDRAGMYVADVFPVDNRRTGTSSAVGGSLANDPAWLENHWERVFRHYRRRHLHPSIVAWGLTGGGIDGYNVQECYVRLKALEKERPVLNPAGSWDNDRVRNL